MSQSQFSTVLGRGCLSACLQNNQNISKLLGWRSQECELIRTADAAFLVSPDEIKARAGGWPWPRSGCVGGGHEAPDAGVAGGAGAGEGAFYSRQEAGSSSGGGKRLVLAGRLWSTTMVRMGGGATMRCCCHLVLAGWDGVGAAGCTPGCGAPEVLKLPGPWLGLGAGDGALRARLRAAAAPHHQHPR